MRYVLRNTEEGVCLQDALDKAVEEYNKLKSSSNLFCLFKMCNDLQEYDLQVVAKNKLRLKKEGVL